MKKEKTAKPRLQAATPDWPALELVKEAKIGPLLNDPLMDRHEASGVYYKDGSIYVIFDSYPNIACIPADLDVGRTAPVLVRQRGERIGYEDIDYQPADKRWYCLIEASEYEPDLIQPRVEEFDDTWRFIEGRWLDYNIASEKKGMEGLSHLCFRGENLLLAMCEGNKCQGGKVGRTPGKGRIQMFRPAPGRWKHVGTIKLPKSVQFMDYSGLDFNQDRMTVISQESSALWVCKVKPDAQKLDEIFVDDGRLFCFPRDAKGQIIYGNLEGVAWIDDRTLVVVSDKAKPKQPAWFADKDQSVHIFKLPDSYSPKAGS